MITDTHPIVITEHPIPKQHRCRYTTGSRAGHHDQLLWVETDIEAMLDFLETAITWHELDYSRDDRIPPEEWLDFAATHQWSDPDRVMRIFSLATDIARCADPGGGLKALAALVAPAGG